MVAQLPEHEIALRFPVERADIADHLARQYGSVRLDHYQATARETAAAGPRSIRRAHHVVHRSVEHCKAARESGGCTVCSGYTRARAGVVRFRDSFDGLVRGHAAHARELDLI